MTSFGFVLSKVQAKLLVHPWELCCFQGVRTSQGAKGGDFLITTDNTGYLSLTPSQPVAREIETIEYFIMLTTNIVVYSTIDPIL